MPTRRAHASETDPAPPIVTIAGCGAVGSLLAARLLHAGIPVQAYQRAGAQLRALQSTGIVLEGDPIVPPSPLPLRGASDDPAGLEPSRLAVVCVKSYHTSTMGPLADLLTPDAEVLTLQNGVGNGEWLAEAFGPHRVCAGAISYGAHRTSPGVVRWGGEGDIVLGPWPTTGPAANRNTRWIAGLFRSAGLHARWVDDPRPALWTKLAINAMINPLTALLRVPNGALRERPAAVALMRAIAEEAVAAAGRAGAPIGFDDVWAVAGKTLQTTALNRSSMLQDVEAGRRTEIDAIAGPILRPAATVAHFSPLATMHALVTALEQGGEHRNC